MAVDYVSVMLITASTVGKVLLCTAVGMVFSGYLRHRVNSEKGFTYICVRVMLPLLIFSSLCLSVSWHTLQEYYWALLIAMFPIIVGIIGASFCKIFLNSTYTGMLILGCTFQNGLTYPMSLLLNLKGISWFGPDELEVSVNHIFLYNVICSIGLWAIGEPVIKYYKALEVLEDKKANEEHRRQLRLAEMNEMREGESEEFGVVFPFTTMAPENDSAPPTGPVSPVGSSPVKENGGTAESGKLANTFQQFAWYRQAGPEDEPLQATAVVAADVVAGDGEESAPPSLFSPASICRMLTTVVQALQSPIVAASFLAIFISLVPPLRWLAETMPGEIALSGFALIGSGAIPLQLLILGGTIIGKKKSMPEGEGVVEENHVQASWLERLKSQQSLFVISSIVIRLIIVPAVCFAAIHFLSTHNIIPNDKVFLLTMFIGVSCPSAINSSIICVMHDYHAKEYAHMIFIMYVSAVFFTTFWLFIYVLYLS